MTKMQKKIEIIPSSSNNITIITQRVINKDTNIHKPPHYYRMATVEGIDNAEQVIYLNIRTENAPKLIFGTAVQQTWRLANLQVNGMVFNSLLHPAHRMQPAGPFTRKLVM